MSDVYISGFGQILVILCLNKIYYFRIQWVKHLLCKSEDHSLNA